GQQHRIKNGAVTHRAIDVDRSIKPAETAVIRQRQHDNRGTGVAMPWNDIGGGAHWGDVPGWAAVPEPTPAPPPPLNLPMAPAQMAPPPAAVAPPVAAPAGPAAPVEPLGPPISAGGPIISKLQPGGGPPQSTGALLAGSLLPPPSIWTNQPQRPAT